MSGRRKLTLVSIGTVALGCLAGLLESSSPMGVNKLLVCAAFVVPFWWLLRLLVFVCRPRQDRRTDAPNRFWSVGIWTVEPILVLATMWLYHQDLPLKLRFRASEPALTHHAASASAHPDRIVTPTRVGLYIVRETQPLPNGGWRFTTDTWSVLFTDSFGFAYCPKGAPQPGEWEEFTHLNGPWYLWSQLG